MHPNFEREGRHPGPASTTPAAAARCRRRASRGRRRGGRGRASRGDVRAAVLQLLAEEPMHGYQLMQAIAERSGGRWTPSPGAIYPTINQLEDEGLVTVTADVRPQAGHPHRGRPRVHRGARRDVGRPVRRFDAGAPGTDLRAVLEQLHGAVRQVGRTGTDAQRAAAATILADARRSLYLLLADGPEAPGS